MNLLDNFMGQLGAGDTIKDYRHASRLFVDNNFALTPKAGWLFHVFFDLDPSLTRVNRDRNLEAGMLVKGVDLPRFTVDTKTYNSYNRVNIVQNKIKYDPVTITFHDDRSNVVRNLWFDYFNYYYRDTDNGYGDPGGGVNPIYYARHKYHSGQRDVLNKFGYTPRTEATNTQYFQAIRIYSLNQKRFAEYTLINPTITSFRHGSHDTGQDNSILENIMTISYETVLYASGQVSLSTVRGFADLHYDKSPSPLSVAGGGTNSILGPGGIFNAVDSVISDASDGNYGSAAFKLFRGYQKNKNINFGQLASTELITAGVDLIRGQDPRNRFYVPYSGQGASGFTPAGQSINGVVGNSTGVSSNGSFIGGLKSSAPIIGTAIAATGNPGLGAGVGVAGLLTTAAGKLKGGAFNKVVGISYNSPLNATGAVALNSTETYKTKLEKIVADKQAEVGAAKTQKNLESIAQATGQAPNNSSILLSPYLAGVPQQIALTFSIGTNDTTEEINPLQLTPGGGKIIPASVEVANSNAAKFTNDGNLQNLVKDITGNFDEGSPTPPIPRS
jgi:hypothetical protein